MVYWQFYIAKTLDSETVILPLQDLASVTTGLDSPLSMRTELYELLLNSHAAIVPLHTLYLLYSSGYAFLDG